MTEKQASAPAEKTKEQLAAEKAAEKKAAAEAAKKVAAEKKAADKAAADKAKTDAKAKAEADKKAKADAKAAKDKEAADKKAAADKVKADKAAAVAKAKADKEASRQPMQNGVRRPSPTGLCGKVWSLADALSAELKQPVPVADLLKAGEAQGLNTSNIRTEYARWKKFHGLAGRIVKPAAETTAAAAPAAA
jgi:hypothetical protein